MRYSSVVLAALILASSAARASEPVRTPLVFEVDARVELLSAVLMLSEAEAPRDAYEREARAYFGEFSGHPAVARLSRLRSGGTTPEQAARFLLDDSTAAPGGKEEGAALSADLRDFSRRSKFDRFFKAHAAAYRAYAAEAERESLRAISPEAAAAYLGRPFVGEHHFIIAPLLRSVSDDEPIGRRKKRVYHLRPGVLADSELGFQLDSFEHSPAFALTYDALSWIASAEARTMLADAALLRVLALDLGEEAFRDFPRQRVEARHGELDAAAQRLKAYERDRVRYPTLAEFYPRLTAPEFAPEAAEKPAVLVSSSPAVDIVVDPRIELLGAVALLAGPYDHEGALGEYRAKAEKRFAAFRGHPAVRLYQELLRTGREDACSNVLLYYSAPPELALLDPLSDVPHLGPPGAREQMQHFLWELRSFAKDSKFMEFFRESGAFHDVVRASVRKQFGPADPAGQIEAYLGLGLSSRIHYSLPLLYGNRHAYIIPYPLPESARPGVKSFDVYSNVVGALSGRADIPVWNEIVYVFIDPSFHYFERMNIADPAAFYGPEIAKCRGAYSNCAKDYTAWAIVARLNHAGLPENPYVRALYDRLTEYERSRSRYKSLWEFYPRLFSVFHETAFPGARRVKLSVPASPKIRNATDFFEPAITGKLPRASR